jgi:hypothetical protein
MPVVADARAATAAIKYFSRYLELIEIWTKWERIKLLSSRDRITDM